MAAVAALTKSRSVVLTQHVCVVVGCQEEAGVHLMSLERGDGRVTLERGPGLNPFPIKVVFTKMSL